VFRFIFLQPKRAHHPRADEILPRSSHDAIQPRLHRAIERNAYEHHREDHHSEQRNRTREHNRGLRIHRKRQYRRAEHDKRRTKQQPQREVNARLRLVAVAGQPCHQSGDADRVQIRKRERLNL